MNKWTRKNSTKSYGNISDRRKGRWLRGENFRSRLILVTIIVTVTEGDPTMGGKVKVHRRHHHLPSRTMTEIATSVRVTMIAEIRTSRCKKRTDTIADITPLTVAIMTILETATMSVTTNVIQWSTTTDLQLMDPTDRKVGHQDHPAKTGLRTFVDPSTRKGALTMECMMTRLNSLINHYSQILMQGM